MDQTGFAMHQTWCSIHGATVDIGQRLVTQTDPKGRNFSAEVRNISRLHPLPQECKVREINKWVGPQASAPEKKDGVVAFNSELLLQDKPDAQDAPSSK